LPTLTKGGRLVIVGSHSGAVLAIDPHVFYRNEWEIIGSRNASVREVVDAVDLVRSAAVTPVVDTEFGLAEVAHAFDRIERGEVVGRDVLIP
ncbi:MAG: zinc-binding dehydrogenase, partial [Acidimicrobiia bacterium]|nr:zinc-binding dehydrogenase [Acidimicrobiia bacterium]